MCKATGEQPSDGNRSVDLQARAREAIRETSVSAPVGDDDEPVFLLDVTEEAPRRRPRMVAAVRAAVHLASRDLGIDVPDIRFEEDVTPARAGEIAREATAEGRVDRLRRLPLDVGGTAGKRQRDGARVTVRLDLEVREAVVVALHETRHLAHPDGITGYEEKEEDANAYAVDAYARFWPVLAEEVGRAYGKGPGLPYEPTVPTR